MKQYAALIAVALLSAEAFAAYDTYQWNDQGNHDLLTGANWLLNNQMPATFPPALDTATSGSTHPYLHFGKAESDVRMVNGTSQTINWFGATTVDTLTTLDLGANSTLELFGGQESAFWLGNYPSGNYIVLKSGTIKGCDGSVKHSNIRLGAGVATWSPAHESGITVDGPTARILNLDIDVGSCKSTFAITNGGYVAVRSGNGIRIENDMEGGQILVTGAGSQLVGMNETSILFGDGTNQYDRMSGSLVVNDGGCATNMGGTVGNRASNFSVLVDNGKWYGNKALSLGSYDFSTNNALRVVNGGMFVYPDWVAASDRTVVIGSSGNNNRMEVENSTFGCQSLRVGWYASAHHNEAIFSNATVNVSTLLIGGTPSTGGTGGTCNKVTFVDTNVGTPENPTTSISLSDSRDGVLGTNTLEFVRSSWYNPSAYFGLGAWDSQSRNNNANKMVIRDHSTVVSTNGSNGVMVGRAGQENVLEVTDFSSYSCDSLSLGEATSRVNVRSNELHVGNGSAVKVRTYLQASGRGNRIVVDNGTLSCNHTRWYYIWSNEQGKTLDSYDECKRTKDDPTHQNTWATRLEFKGAAPAFIVPGDVERVTNGIALSDLHILDFELPENPYPEAVFRSTYQVKFANGVNYGFDFSKVGIAGGKYVLAEALGTASLTLGTTALDEMQAAATAAATAVGRKAKIYVDGKKLVCKVSSNLGMTIILR